ncbi:MAG: NUDIX domain-containing protein [Fimbriiglobus sp.]|jgi:8-oxo-dGTP pyrophosphatase MutT (NUDIX family)|nr:NUDIX domain-containing protein [Fimbriiglobus sp.]
MPSAVRQAAAIPLRDGLVCMVTSRSRRRWVLPKGRIEVKQSPAEAAAAEAWEEAGLIGRLSDQPVGSYEYEKYRQVHRVQVFVLQVDSERSQWPEWKERTREWVTPEEAIARIEEPELRAVVAAVCGVGAVGVG